MPGTGAPRFCHDRAARHFNRHNHFATVFTQRGIDRQLVKIRIVVNGDLVALAVDTLMKITLTVE